jgi:hypothetical protein
MINRMRIQNVVLAWWATMYASIVLLSTGLAFQWGSWYSFSVPLRQQTEALLRGKLALSDSPGDLAHDHAWSRGGVHQVWGLGVPLWRLIFEGLASVCGEAAFPDRIAFGIALTSAAWLAMKTYFGPLQNPLPSAGKAGMQITNVVSVFILLAFPPFLTLLRTRFAVYEEIAAYFYVYGLILFLSLMQLHKTFSVGRYYWLCAAAGMGPLLRPTLIFYGAATLLLAGALAWRARLRGLRFWAGPGLVLGAGLVLFWFNSARFGSGFEFGHRLNVQSYGLCGSMYATRFDHPYAREPWWSAARELFGAVFLVEKNFNGRAWYAGHIFPGQSETLRWREFYFSTFDLSYILLPLGMAVVIRAAKGRLSGTSDLFTESSVAAFWSSASLVLLACFYLRTPVISSRYVFDLAPALAVVLVTGFRSLPMRVIRPFAALLAGWAVWEMTRAGNFYGEPRAGTWAEVNLARTVAAQNRFNPDLPASYSLGSGIEAFGIPLNGRGWDHSTGAVMPLAVFFVKDPAWLELELVAADGREAAVSDMDCIRAKIGLEFLGRSRIHVEGRNCQVRFNGPLQAQYQRGIQPAFVVFTPPNHLSDESTPWRLVRISWR